MILCTSGGGAAFTGLSSYLRKGEQGAWPVMDTVRVSPFAHRLLEDRLPPDGPQSDKGSEKWEVDQPLQQRNAGCLAHSGTPGRSGMADTVRLHV